MKSPLFRAVSQYPEYKEYRKQQRKDFLFYLIINILICLIGSKSQIFEISVISDFLFTAFIISIFGLAVYTAKHPSIHKGIIQEKNKKGKTYIHTVRDEYNKYLCTYRTLGDVGLEVNDSVYVLNKSHVFKNTEEIIPKEDTIYEENMFSNF